MTVARVTAGRLARALLLAAALGALPVAAQGQAQAGQGRARFEQLLQQRLGMSGAQMQRLQATNRTLAPQRRALARRERAIADSLTAQIGSGAPQDAVVSTLIDRLFAVRRDRLALREREQREWAEYLTPRQRAMLLGLQERAQRGGEALQQGTARRRRPLR